MLLYEPTSTIIVMYQIKILGKKISRNLGCKRLYISSEIKGHR